ncbi:RICIN domain-containing protein [Streptomyces phyllanthi]|uniref:RICIN domain-containing protein n=1 Tax=Streptomyces phyllanthi TaxID=1803180 RepID=UPI001D13792B|nr:RICIN domain-containing protein [Streptomyces phyllanthi]
MGDINEPRLTAQAADAARRPRGRHRKRWTVTGLLIGVPAVLGPYLLLSQPESEAATIDSTAYYRLVSVNSGKVLEVAESSTADGAKAVQRTDNGGQNQQWRLKATDSGHYELVNRSSGKALGVKGASTANKAAVEQSAASGAANQQWKITDLDGGAIEVVNRNSGKVLDVRARSTADGAAVIQYKANGGTNQQWKLAAVPGTGTGTDTASGSPSTPATPSASASDNTGGDGATSGGGNDSGSGNGTTLAQKLTVSKVTLPAAFRYLEPGYNQLPQWTRVDTQAAPDGSVRVAWPASDGVHVTSLSPSLERQGTDTVVPNTEEVSGLVAHNNGFALLTRVPDSNKWDETAAALIRYKDGSVLFNKKLTGTASNDTSPVLDGALKWNGSKYGAYFVVHGAGGFADGHFGDKLAYVDDAGTKQSGGWDWGCSHNEGIALAPAASGAFPSLCFDDWRSGLFVSTGISAPDDAPVVQREQCWAGYCGGAYPGNSGDLVKTTGGYATAFASRGAASAVKNTADSSGRGWTVTPKTDTHQVTVAFLKDASTPGSTVKLTDDPTTDHVNVHITPYGKNLLVSWESVADATCKDGTCTGKFTGTHLQVIDHTGKPVSADEVVDARIAGDIATLPDSSLTWAFVSSTPDYGSAMRGTSPTTTTLSVARLTG